MILSPTTFVLGAGVSQEFGFPSGYALCNALAAPDDIGSITGCATRLLECGFSMSDIMKFSHALRLSGKLSVDAFLEHREEFIAIGKAGIAVALIPGERSFALFARGEGHQTLYDYLWRHLNAMPSAFPRNRVSIVTFNYDRSLEQYLSTVLTNGYGLAAKEAAVLAKAIEIHHVHGTLGDHPAYGDGERARDYVPSVSFEAVQLAARCIRVVHEQAADDAGFIAARRALQESARVVFLGFGYDPTNLARLQIVDLPPTTEVFGSAFGLTQRERQVVTKAFNGRITLGQPDQDATMFLREYVTLE